MQIFWVFFHRQFLFSHTLIILHGNGIGNTVLAEGKQNDDQYDENR